VRVMEVEENIWVRELFFIDAKSISIFNLFFFLSFSAMDNECPFDNPIDFGLSTISNYLNLVL
jgi:hypothetical protein